MNVVELLEAPITEAKGETTEVADKVESIDAPNTMELVDQVTPVQDEVIATEVADEVAPVRDEVIPAEIADEVALVQDEVISTEAAEVVALGADGNSYLR